MELISIKIFIKGGISMKKVLSVVLVLLLLISFACPVFALPSADENTISGVELSIKRTKSKILGQSKTELANEILAELGLEDSLIEKLAEERKIEVADAYEINRKMNTVRFIPTVRFCL